MNQIPHDFVWFLNKERNETAAHSYFVSLFPDQPDMIPFLYELLGYQLKGGNSLKKAIMLLGPGDNGKSVFLRLNKSLLGDQNVSSIKLQTLSENKFAVASLVGKLSNIAGDLDARSVKESDVFKMITGGDSIMGEHKYGRSFQFTPQTKLIFSANEMPHSADQSTAWFDRWIVVPFSRTFTEKERSLFIESRLHTEDALEGLLVYAVEGLLRLRERGSLEVPGAVQAASREYREDADSALAFINETALVSADQRVLRSSVYRAYQAWSLDTGRKPLKATTFYFRIRDNFRDVREVRRADGWYLDGLGLPTAARNLPPI